MIVDEVTYHEDGSDSKRNVATGLIVGLAVGAGLAALLSPASARRLLGWASRRRQAKSEAATPATPSPISRAYVRQAAVLTAQGIADIATEAAGGVRRQIRGVTNAIQQRFRDAKEEGREAAGEAQQEAWTRYHVTVQPRGRESEKK